MSLLFDSLRKGRSRSSGGRPGQADEVLATLGYAPQARGRRPARIIVVALCIGLVGLGYWFWRSGDLAQSPSSAPRSAATRTSFPAGQPRAGSGSLPSGSTRQVTPAPPPVTATAAPSSRTQLAPFPGAPPVAQARPSVSEAQAAATQTPSGPLTQSPMSNVTQPGPRTVTSSPQAVPSLPSAPRRAEMSRSAPASRDVLDPELPPADPVGRTPPRSQSFRTEPRVPARVPDARRVEPGGSDEFRLALYYHRAGDYEKALTHYRAVLAQNELNAEAHNNLGLLHQQRGLLDEAVREFQRATFINGRYGRAHSNLGVTYMRQGKLDLAVAQFELALSIDPRDSDAMVNLALAQRAARQEEAARTTLLKALTINPENAAAHYNLALFYDQLGETARAVEHYRSFLTHAGVEHAALAGQVRSRISTLSAQLR